MTNRFGVGARLLHWLVVLLLLVQIPAGIAMIAPGLEQGSIDRLFVLHKGLGVVLLVVVLSRVLWRLTHPAPPMSEAIPERERRRVARATTGKSGSGVPPERGIRNSRWWHHKRRTSGMSRCGSL